MGEKHFSTTGIAANVSNIVRIWREQESAHTGWGTFITTQQSLNWIMIIYVEVWWTKLPRAICCGYGKLGDGCLLVEVYTICTVYALIAHFIPLWWANLHEWRMWNIYPNVYFTLHSWCVHILLLAIRFHCTKTSV